MQQLTPKMFRRSRRHLLLCMLLLSLPLFVALGCDTLPPEPPVNPAAQAVPTAAVAPVPSALATVKPVEPIALPTPTPTPTATPTPTPTATSVPEPTVEVATPSEPVQAKVARISFGVDALAREYSVMRHGSQSESIQYRPEYEHLVAMDPTTGAIIPELATEWEILPDGNSFLFKLREGVQFHRGWGEFTARDVVHTHDQLVRMDSQHDQSSSWRSDVQVEFLGDYEVVFRLSRPTADFLSAVGEQRSLMPIQSRAHFEAHDEPPRTDILYIAGTGPYQMLQRQVGSRILFERPPETHWRVTPDFQEFEYRFQSDPSVRLAGLLTGEIHLAHLPFDLQSQAMQKGMKLARGPAPVLGTWVNISCCWVDPETGAYPARPDSPMTNVKVRKALAKTIDRPLFNEVFFNNNAEIMYLNHWHPTRLGWNPDWETNFSEEYGYDPAAAKELLAEAGFNENNRLETTFELFDLSHYSSAQAIAEGISGYMRDVGVRMNLLTRAPDYRRAAREAMVDDNLLTMAASSSDQYLGFAEWTTPIFSEYNANNMPAITELTKKVLRTQDLEQQQKVWKDLGNMSYAAYLTLPLFWFHTEAVYNPEFVSDYVYPGSLPGLWTHVHNIRAAQ